MQPQAYPGYAPGYAPAAPARSGINPAILVLIVGLFVVAALVGVGVLIAVSGGKSGGTTEKGSVSIDPSTFSCSANATVTLTVSLPAALSGDDRISTKLDGTSWGDVKISNQFDKQSDGTWLESHSSILNTCQGPKGKMSDGSHTLQIVDVQGHVVAETTFTTTP
ncbi:MAG: hypothetical protein ABSB75_00480 [Candidatus Limnocylindrales bacterium]